MSHPVPHDEGPYLPEDDDRREHPSMFDIRLWSKSPDCKPWCDVSWWSVVALVCYCKAPRMQGQPLSDFGSGDGDMTPDGRDIASWNRSIINPQMQAIQNLNERARERK